MVRLSDAEAAPAQLTPLMRPALFPLDAIPFERMPADDALWYPAVLWEGRNLKVQQTPPPCHLSACRTHCHSRQRCRRQGVFGFDGTRLVVHHLHDVVSL